MNTREPWKEVIKRMVNFCHDVTGKGRINENLIAFYAKELWGIPEIQLKAAFNFFASDGVFPTVVQLREQCQVKTNYEAQKQSSGSSGKTFEEKRKKENEKLSLHSSYSFDTPYAIEEFAPRNIQSREEAESYFKTRFEQLKDKCVYIDPLWNRKLMIDEVIGTDSQMIGNKLVEVRVKLFKCIAICRTVRTEEERTALLLMADLAQSANQQEQSCSGVSQSESAIT